MLTINQSLKHIGYGSAIALFLFIPCNSVLAQITPDSTLGAEGSSILPRFSFSWQIRRRITAKKIEVVLDFGGNFR
ncbi:hypothetical protein [Coleofasciculus sp. F4-SAH-05]|uniref:hypothetical protein n=1 Tax=Coleofasciculus sp. F4-SAH-05 TaxID=3069525 RepID=UPI0032F9F9CD